MNKKGLTTVIIIILVILLATFILNRSTSNDISEKVAKCIGEKAILYIQLGCHACEIQEETFGEYYKHLTVVDCFFDREECLKGNIEATPTWVINGGKYKGAHSIDKLKELTGC